MPPKSPSGPASGVGFDRRLLSAALWLTIIAISLFALRVGKDFFVPLLIALIAVYLISALSRLAQRIRLAGQKPPVLVTNILSFALIFGFGYVLFRVLIENALQVAALAPGYKATFLALQQEIFDRFSLEEPPGIEQLIRDIDVQQVFTVAASTAAGVLGSVSLVVLYSVFFLLELRFLPSKIYALFPDADNRARVVGILTRIDRDIHTYLGVKTLVSAITATISYLIMRAVGLNFAEFWALLIFFFNYIPTIGSIVSTIFPTLLAAVQFQALAPFLVIGLGITAVQQLMGNLLEPNLMGQTLNISPLVVFVSLIFWGNIWGILGMFLCVPITVILVIVLANFDSTRWVAILLSKAGTVRRA